MTTPTYKIYKGSLQERFFASRAKIKLYAGGFANGKTSAAIVHGLQLASMYPGSNGLIGRSTYPKLVDTILPEFDKWCPEHWLDRFPKSQRPTAYMKNGSTINFRYVQQSGTKDDEGTSNLLSATYDWIVIDQCEDPEIEEKDFLDMLGRLRGSAPYIGEDKTMPQTGPRWMILTCNPTRNWVYRKIVRPTHIYNQTGQRLPELMVDRKTGEPIVEVFEGSTYDNKDNLSADYIMTLESAYTGSAKERFLYGKWAAYQGLVHPEFDETVNVISHKKIVDLYTSMKANGVIPNIIEGYDDGLAAPSCYILAWVDDDGNVFLMDGGYYTSEEDNYVEYIAEDIQNIRREYNINTRRPIYADPAIFRRGRTSSKLVGESVSRLFDQLGVRMQRGNNNVENGIRKINTYLRHSKYHFNPFTGELGAPRLYVSDKLQWFVDEITDYYWKKNNDGDAVDYPQDKKDHAMNTLKYALSFMPDAGRVIQPKITLPDDVTMWREYDDSNSDNRSHRYVN